MSSGGDVKRQLAVFLRYLTYIFIPHNFAHHNPNTSENPHHLDLLPGTLPLSLPGDPPPFPFDFPKVEIGVLNSNKHDITAHPSKVHWSPVPAGISFDASALSQRAVRIHSTHPPALRSNVKRRTQM